MVDLANCTLVAFSDQFLLMGFQEVSQVYIYILYTYMYNIYIYMRELSKRSLKGVSFA